MARRRTRESAERRPRRRLGVFSLAFLAVLAAAAWFAPAVLVHTSLRDRPLEAALAGINGRVMSGSATWNWVSGIEYRDVMVVDPAGRPAVIVASLVIEKGILGLVIDPRNLGTVRLSGVEAVVAVRPGGSSLEDILAPWLAGSSAPGGIACDLELVAATVELFDVARTDAWRLTDVIAAGTVRPEGTLAGWTMAGRVQHAGPRPADSGSELGRAAGQRVASPPDQLPRLDRTTIPAAAAAALARDGGWSISAPAAATGEPRPLAVTAHRLPLGVSSVAATRFGSPRLIDGLADGRLDTPLEGNGGDAGGRIVVDNLAVCRADTLAEELTLDHCELPFDVAITPEGLIAVRELRAISPVVRVEVSGRLPVPRGDAWRWLEACAAHDCALAAEVDLAAAANSLPGGLAVRPEVRITAGSLHLGAVARGDGADRVLEVRLDSRNVAAVRTVSEPDATGESALAPIGVALPQERPLRWSEPFTAWLKGRKGPAPDAGLRVEEARITSQAAEFSATGTPAALQMQWTIDLGELCGELAEVIDLGGMLLAGRSRGRVDVERAGGGTTAVRAVASVTGFELMAPGRPAWKDDSIALDAEATGSFAQGRTSIDSARGMLTAAGDSLEATLAGGVVINPAAMLWGDAGTAVPTRSVAGSSEVSADCSIAGDLGRWHRRLAAVMPALATAGLELGGSLEASAAVATDPAAGGDVWRITRAGGEIEKFAARLGDRQASEPRIVVTAAGLVRPATGRIEISSAELLSSSLSLRSGGLSWQPASGGSTVTPPAADQFASLLACLRGRVQWQADIGRVEHWVVSAATAQRWPIAGRAWGTLDAAETQTGLNLLVEMTGSQVVVAERPTGAGGDPPPRPVWNEPQATLTLEVTRPFAREAGGGITLADRLIVERLALESSTVAVAARGSVEDVSRQRKAAIEGTVSYDWDQLSRLLTPWTGGRIRVAGSGGRPFTFRGPLTMTAVGGGVGTNPAPVTAGTLPLPDSWLAATRGSEAQDATAAVRVPARPTSTSRGLIETLRAVSFDTSTAWTAADLDGFSVSAGDLAVRLVEGQLALGPFDVAASGGRIRGAPWVKLAPYPGELVVPPGRIVDRVTLTGDFCQRFIGWVSPVLAGAANASGTVSIDLAGARVPLGHPFAGEAGGQIVFEQLEIKPSGGMQPLVNLLAKLQAVVDPRFAVGDQAVLMRVRPEPVRVQLVDGRIWHDGLVIDAGQFTVRSQGSVGQDGSLTAVVEVALRGDVAGEMPVIAQLMRTPITIPLKGTLSRPQFDAGALDVAFRRIVENTAQAVFDDGLGRGIEALFGKPPAPPPGSSITLPR